MTAQQLFRFIEEMAIANEDIIRHGVLPYGGPDEARTASMASSLWSLLEEIDKAAPGQFLRAYIKL